MQLPTALMTMALAVRETPSQASRLAGCVSVADCGYNGECRASGVCKCSPQWTGESCTKLNLVPASRTGGFRSPHLPPASTPQINTSSWGGSILHDSDTGLWHMYAAEMVGNCGIGAWVPNSQVVHATATQPTGPFTRRAVVVSPFAHEPNAVRSPAGDWVIYFTMRHPPGGRTNCTELKSLITSESVPGMPPGMRFVNNTGDPLPMSTYMVHSKFPDGPWSEPIEVLTANTSIWDGRVVLIDTNLAVTIKPDGSAIGIWRKCENTKGTVCENQCCTFPHLLTASNWKDPASYVPVRDRQMFTGIKPYGAEDPMLWIENVSINGTGVAIVKAILHDEEGPMRETAIGRYAFSDDGGISWHYAFEDAYNGTVKWTDGSSSELFRRERPHMVVDLRGVPVALSNGIQECEDTGPCATRNDRSWTLVQPVAD